MFTFHRDKENKNNLSLYRDGFSCVDTDDIEIIGRLATTFRNSVIRWKDGVRRADNFESANWLMLDFDDGKKTLRDICSTFREHTFVAVTSKSHQKFKGDNPPCDRFHIYAQLPITVTDRKSYTLISRYYAELLGSDRQCSDAGRMFGPGIEVVYSQIGAPLPAIDIKELMQKDKDKGIIRNYYARRYDDSQPAWIDSLLRQGPDAGSSRNSACFRVAARKKKDGWTIEQTVDLLMKSAIPIGLGVEQEVINVVRSAFKNT